MKKLFLGKLTARHDARNLKFADYLGTVLSPPRAAGWNGKILNGWGMMGNDTVGDCTCAAAGHLEMVWTSYNPPPVIPSTPEVLAAYSAITGYTPSNPDSDQGANVTDVLNFWRKSGIAGRKLFAFAAIDQSNADHVKLAVAIFGGCYIGVELPQSAMDDFNAGKSWTRHTGKILGGHALPIVAYDASGLTCITWGREQKMSWAWFHKYCDESFCLISKDWIGKKLAPSGFNLAQLQADLNALKTNTMKKTPAAKKSPLKKIKTAAPKAAPKTTLAAATEKPPVEERPDLHPDWRD